MLKKIFQKLCDIEKEIKELRTTIEATMPEREFDITSIKEGIELRYNR